MLVSPSSRHDSPRQALRDVEWKEEAEASTVTSDRIQLYPRRAGERCADKRPSAKVGSEAAASDATTTRRRGAPSWQVYELGDLGGTLD